MAFQENLNASKYMFSFFRTYESEIPFEYRYVTDTPRARSRNVKRTWYIRRWSKIRLRHFHRYVSDTPLIRECVTSYYYMASDEI